MKDIIFALAAVALLVQGCATSGRSPDSALASDVSAASFSAAPAAGGDRMGNLIYVDAVYGNDARGRRERFDRPFRTCAAAEKAALSGDTIVVRPGTYSAVNLGKAGVNWHLMTGAALAPGAGRYAFNDFETNALRFNLTGNGTLLNGGAFSLFHSNSAVTARFRTLTATDQLQVASARLRLTVEDEMRGDIGTAHGDLTIECRTLRDSAIVLNSIGPGRGIFRFHAEEFVNTGLYQDCQPYAPGNTSRTDLFVKRWTGPAATNRTDQGYALFANDGLLVVHGGEIHQGASGKMVRMDSGCRLILDNCTIVRERGTNYSIVSTAFSNDVVRVIGTLTSNAPLDPKLSVDWGGTLVVNTNLSL